MKAKSNESVLVVAFDGLDSELVKEYGLENVILQETGTIDNDTGIYKRNTSELFASFITGETWKTHGVKDLKKQRVNNPRIVQLFEESVSGSALGRKTSGLRKALYRELNFVKFEDRKWLKKDLTGETIFDKVVGLPLFVPTSKNPSHSFSADMPHILVDRGFSVEEAVKAGHQDTDARLVKLDEVNHEFWDLCMVHFHEPDAAQDLYYSDLESEYQRIDELAEEILEKYGGLYDTLIFVSDHGMSEGEEHNKNAFYSSNKELFDGSTPHITDFHDKLLELTREVAA